METWQQWNQLVHSLPPPEALLHLVFVNTSIVTAIRVIVDLEVASKVPDHGDISLASLAALVDADPGKLARLLRLLFGLGIFKEDKPGSGQVSHTEISRYLTGAGDVVKLVTSELNVRPDMKLSEALRLAPSESGLPPTAAHLALNQGFYDALVAHPEWLGLKAFYSALATLANTLPLIQCRDLWQTFKNTGVPVADVGAGSGHFGIALAQAYPGLQVELQDKEVNQVDVERTIPSELSARVRFRSHDFFEPQPDPPLHGVAYLMQWTLHNLQHEECMTVLRHLVPGLKHPRSRLLIGECLLPEPGSVPTFDELPTIAFDIKMLTLFDAQERSANDWGKLFRQADPALRIERMWAQETTRMTLLEVIYDGERTDEE